MQNAISWFEIPATDLDRATRFYETIFGLTFDVIDLPGIQMRMFPADDPEAQFAGGAVVKSNEHVPSATDGPLIYLNGSPDLQVVIEKVADAGGQVLMPKTEISPEYGFMGLILDTEGNRIGLHSSA